MDDWKSHLTEKQRRDLEQHGTQDFVHAVTSGMWIALTMLAKRQMKPDEARRFDAYRIQRRQRQAYQRETGEEDGWFERVEHQIDSLVGDAIRKLDDSTGGYGQRGTLWAEERVSEAAKKLRNWWDS